MTKIYNTEKVTQLIQNWSIDRNLHTADPMKQYGKLIEEFGEMAEGISKGKKELIVDAIGDMYVVCTILLQQIDFDIFEVAYYNDVAEIEHGNALVDLTGSIYHLGALVNEHSKQTTEAGRFLSGDMILTETGVLLEILRAVAEEYSMNFNLAVNVAYNEIKDRKGVMKDGVFIKEADIVKPALNDNIATGLHSGLVKNPSISDLVMRETREMLRDCRTRGVSE